MTGVEGEPVFTRASFVVLDTVSGGVEKVRGPGENMWGPATCRTQLLDFVPTRRNNSPASRGGENGMLSEGAGT